MTKQEARERLAATWRFNRVGDRIVLREVALVEAVRLHEFTSPSNSPVAPLYANLPRPA